MKLILHLLGLSCIGGAIFLQYLVFADIMVNGYFYGVERNLVVLMAEFMLLCYAAAYYVHLWRDRFSKIRER